MRIFVAGATGVIGRRVVAQFARPGTKSPASLAHPRRRRSCGGPARNPSRSPCSNRDALRDAVAGHDAGGQPRDEDPDAGAERADAGVGGEHPHPRRGIAQPRRRRDRGRRTVFVQESIAFLYGEHGDAWIDAATAEIVDSPVSEPVRAAEANALRFTANGGRGVVLRFGEFQAPDSYHADAVYGAARKGVFLDPASPDVYRPTIALDDAATAVVGRARRAGRHLRHRRRRSDHPGRLLGRARGWQSGAGACIRRPDRAWRRPRPVRSPHSQRVSNRRFRDVTAWRPVARNQRDAVGDIERAETRRARAEHDARVCSGCSPRRASRSGSTPSSSRGSSTTTSRSAACGSWHDGPYNEHLVRDFGAMNLALAAVTLAALYYGSRRRPRAAAIGWLVFSIPHAMYHFRHLSALRDGRQDRQRRVAQLRGRCSRSRRWSPSPGRPRAPRCDVRTMGVVVNPYLTGACRRSARRSSPRCRRSRWRPGRSTSGQGFPDTDGPEVVEQAAIDAIDAGHNQYPPGIGVPDLRHAIAAHQQRFYGLELDPDTEVLVTAGATEAIAAALLALCEPGDEVVTFEPYYDSYAACIAMAGARAPRRHAARARLQLRSRRAARARSRRARSSSC